MRNRLNAIILMIIFFQMNNAASPKKDTFITLPSSFGKTHFIVGMPPEEIQRLKTTAVQKKISTDVYFAPDDNLEKILIDYIMHEQEGIDIAIYTFTNKKIADALIQAKNRGIRIRIVIDRAAQTDRFGKIPLLVAHDIPVYVYRPALSSHKPQTLNDIMHNKSVIFMKNKANHALVWTGSFNFTKSGALSNQENVIVIDTPAVVQRYMQQFEKLLYRSAKIVM